MKKGKFRIATLGCRTNQYEAQAFRDQLLGLGYEEAEGDESADLCIVNTCTVTEGADSSSRHQIRQFAKKNKGAEVVVTGCLAERRPDLVKEIEGVTRVIANKDKEKLVESLFPGLDVPEFSIKNFEAHTRAFVKVQDGCNSFCTYCIIPYVRGKSRSRSIESVVKEIEGLIENGYQEIVITGINVGDYRDGDKGLADLIRTVDRIEGMKRLRLSSIDPDEVDADLMDAILNGEHTCHSLHIVLQSGSNVILKKMNRKYTRHVFLETIEKLKASSSDFTATTDIIVGFPGETESDFEETLSVMRDVQFAKVHMFPYSKRERTRAALFPNPVPEQTIQERKNRLLKEEKHLSYALREKYIGRVLSVLTEEGDEEGVCGHTANFLKVRIENPLLRANQMVTVRLTHNTEHALIGALE